MRPSPPLPLPYPPLLELPLVLPMAVGGGDGVDRSGKRDGGGGT
jgi:hypothetical protein